MRSHPARTSPAIRGDNVIQFPKNNAPKIINFPRRPEAKPYVGKGMFGGKAAGLSWQERMAQQYGSKNPGFGYQPQSTYAEQARMAEQAARNRELGKGISWQPWKDPKTPLSSSMKGPPPGMKPSTGIAESLPAGGMGVSGAGASLSAGAAARGAGLITGISIAGSASLGFQIGAGIADLINKIDPGGKEFLDDLFGEEVDAPPGDGGEREAPMPPAPAPGQPYPPGSGSSSSYEIISGVSATGFVTVSYPNGSQNDGVGAGCIYDLFVGYSQYHLHIQEDRQYTVTVEPTEITRFGVIFLPQNPGEHLNRSSGQYWRWDNGWYKEYDNGQLIIFSATSHITIKRLDSPAQDPNLKNPLYAFRNNDPYSPNQYLWWDGFRWTSVSFRPIPAISRFKRYIYPDEPIIFPDYSYPPYEVDGKDPFQQGWQRTDTWNPPKEENDMSCDLSPVMQQLQQQKSQITTLQNTVNNISLNTSSVQNINANTTTVVNNAISSINSNTSSVVNSATNAINSNTVSTVNAATNAINSNTVSTVNAATNAINSSTASTVNNAANAINSNIANLSSKLSQVGDDILAGVRSGFAALEAWLKPALNVIETAVKNLADEFAKFLEKFTKFLKWIQFDRILNLLILVSTIHNAAMLSNQLGSSLISMANSLLTAGGNALGLRGVEDEPIDIGPAINGVFQSLADGFIGKENNAELKKQWNKYNRIYQAAANLLGSIQSLNQSILSALEIVGGKVARIGNALRKWGEVSESAFNWMNPQPFFSNPFSRFAEKAQEGVENTDQVAQEVIGAQQQVAQIQKEIDDFKELLDKEEKTGIAEPVPAKTTAKETEAKNNSTTGATPLLPSEKTGEI